MCIRDRQEAEALGQLGRDQLAQAPVVDEHQQAHALQRRGGCLLYTSDAADERSSVDLGGRRIIKKKKTLKPPRKKI